MASNQREAAILGLGTALPSYRYAQSAIAEWLVEALRHQNRTSMARRIPQMFAATGIDYRYSCLPDGFGSPAQSGFVADRATNKPVPTSERMAIYQRESIPLGVAAAQAALHDLAVQHELAPEAAAESITHLIVVSCTGFFAPGLDQAIALRIGLRPTVERTLIGFMGCAAAFNALRNAVHMAEARPNTRVLIVCVELCALHFQADTNMANLIATSIFADGAAACVVGIPAADYAGDSLAIAGSYSALMPDTPDEMVWKIGDQGFALQLSTRIPDLLSIAAPQAISSMFPLERPAFWAIHPGGRAIVDALEAILQLPPEAVEPSRTVLRECGNMSSPTILFVLHEMRDQLRQSVNTSTTGVAMAFGPGLVVEMAKLTYQPAAAAQMPRVRSLQSEAQHVA
jgi:predicted naringenin-chalcone synthase